LERKNIPAVINVPNIDPGARNLLALMNNHKGNENFLFINNLSRDLFINLYRHATFQIGNSSSGILEAASVPLPVINVGRRMTGRRSQENVIFVGSSRREIEKSILIATSDQFHSNYVKGIRNIYGDGYSSRKAYSIIKKLRLASFSRFRMEDPLKLNNMEHKT
jgi:UDP-N-acetylglucosamine 2-epimerase